MLVMTAKVDKKKIAIILAGIVVLIAGLAMVLGGGKEAAPTVSSAVSVVGNDDRVRFLGGFGWEVTTSPTESSQVKIPESSSEVFERYNALQKSQGYDLSPYAGQTVMRYVYQVNNYPGATEPVYATLLIRKNQVIGGDVTDTSAKGIIQGFRKPEGTSQDTTTPTQPQADTADTADTAATQPLETTAPEPTTAQTKRE